VDTSLLISPKRYSLVAFLLLAFVIAWGFWISAALASKGLLPFPFPVTLAGVLGAWGPGLAGTIITAVKDGRDGLRMLFKRLSVWRVGIQWYLFVLLWPAVLSLLVTALSMLFGSSSPDFANPPVTYVYPAPPEAFSAGFLPLLPIVFVTQVFGSSMGEEIGWRGFALPRLQARQSALLASGILGVVWGLWHLPRVWTPGDPFDVASFGWLMMGLVLNSVLYTWVFNNTRGSLLLVLLFHTAQPVTTLFLAKVSNPLVENVLIALLVILVVTQSGAGHLTREPTSAAHKIS
jgi:membrane protease YdiL (CAAX protease family)